MKVKNYEFSDNLIAEIGKFAILWNIFEKIHCNFNCNITKIKDACKYLCIDKVKQAKLAKTLNAHRIWFEQLRTDYIVEKLYSNDRHPTEEEIQSIETFLKQDGDNLIYGCILCIYRIRNNMMHGLKDIETLNEQIGIFQAVNEILESI